MNFTEKLTKITNKNNSLLCVGLDSELAKLPEHLKSNDDPQFEFNKAIIDATKDLVCCYKPNMAFYEAKGVKGYEALKKTIEYIPDHIPVLLDAKRGDIGNTSRLYAQCCFEYFGADAVTIHAYMGTDTVKPFLDYAEKALFILVKTSNPSSVEFEDIEDKDSKKVYMHMAEKIVEWQKLGPTKIGAVIGATFPDDLIPVRQVLPEAPLLIPGLGKQGGDAENTIKNGVDSNQAGIIVNSSRGIIFASDGEDFADVARQKASELRTTINQYRQ